ncbi:hypothetical protein HZH68_008786 [Vespula germanica]|uniref:Uncharacterized protein n=1 Tax=Vespula germanica TaxID=30212 RepID=A0A834N7C5_VESGE|nr:hypothetical protein HZH68_008786 [Vespula germanica]
MKGIKVKDRSRLRRAEEEEEEKKKKEEEEEEEEKKKRGGYTNAGDSTGTHAGAGAGAGNGDGGGGGGGGIGYVGSFCPTVAFPSTILPFYALSSSSRSTDNQNDARKSQ